MPSLEIKLARPLCGPMEVALATAGAAYARLFSCFAVLLLSLLLTLSSSPAYAENADSLEAHSISPQRRSYELNEVGVKLILSGQREAGLQKLQQAIELDANNSTALYNSAGIYLSDGHPERAVDIMKKAVKLAPQDVSFRNRLAEAYFATSDVREAINTYESIVAIAPEHEQSLLRLGTLYALEKQWDKAEASLRHACLADPKNPVAFSNLGNVLVVKKKYKEAIEVLREAQDTFGPSAENEVALGVACEAIDENRTALQHYRLAKKLGSTDPRLDEHINSLAAAQPEK